MIKPTEQEIKSFRALRMSDDFRHFMDFMGKLIEEQNQLMIFTPELEDLPVLQGRLQLLTHILNSLLEQKR